jgi:hypothetical protein
VGRHAARLLRQEDRAGERDIATPPTSFPRFGSTQAIAPSLPSQKPHQNSNHVRPILRQHPPRLITITILGRPGLPSLHLSQHNLHLTIRRRMAIRRRKRMERITAAIRTASHNVLVPYLGKYFGRKAAYWGLFAPNSPVLMQSTDEGKQGGRSIWSGSTRCILRLRIRACSRVLVLLKLLPRCEKRGNDRRDNTKSSSTSHITENETIPRPWTQPYDELEEATMDTPAHASGDSSLVVLLQAIIQQRSLSRLSTTRC